jgi:hypothetical protein
MYRKQSLIIALLNVVRPCASRVHGLTSRKEKKQSLGDSMSKALAALLLAQSALVASVWDRAAYPTCGFTPDAIRGACGCAMSAS